MSKEIGIWDNYLEKMGDKFRELRLFQEEFRQHPEKPIDCTKLGCFFEGQDCPIARMTANQLEQPFRDEESKEGYLKDTGEIYLPGCHRKEELEKVIQG